ncbi:hypothetical protein [Ensifer aridi]|uniref:hypothetical protein n=1 Tax=Ensifer aridi TaxID=1708715 RepID=UPI000A1118B6|nr:hypothetical protein [Ensifer aridi]
MEKTDRPVNNPFSEIATLAKPYERMSREELLVLVRWLEKAWAEERLRVLYLCADPDETLH